MSWYPLTLSDAWTWVWVKSFKWLNGLVMIYWTVNCGRQRSEVKVKHCTIHREIYLCSIIYFYVVFIVGWCSKTFTVGAFSHWLSYGWLQWVASTTSILIMSSEWCEHAACLRIFYSFRTSAATVYHIGLLTPPQHTDAHSSSYCVCVAFILSPTVITIHELKGKGKSEHL